VARAAGEQRRGQRLQVGLPGQPRIERLKQPCRRQQQRRYVAAAAGCERDLAAQQRCLRALELIQRPGLRRGQQPQRRVERASLGRGLRGGQAHTVAIEEAAGNDT
jgi:hypothetical protein